MEINAHDQARIERYVLGQMEAAEAAAFEAECASRPDLMEAVALEQDVRIIARAARLLELKESLETHARSRRRRPQVVRLFAVMATAAAVFLVIYIGWLRPPRYQRLAYEYAQEANTQRSRARGNRAPTDSLGIALDKLAQDKPAEALPYLHGLRKQADAKVLYYLGLTHALLGQADSSRVYLEQYCPESDSSACAKLVEALPEN